MNIINRIKQLMERVSDPNLNNGMPLKEIAPVSDQDARQAYYNNFKKFIEKRHEWRQTLDKADLTNKVVSYYIPNMNGDILQYTAISKAKVIIDFSFMSQLAIKRFATLAGEMPQLTADKNKGVAEAATPAAGGATKIKGVSVSALTAATAAATNLKGYVLIRSKNTNRNMIMNKQNIVPSNLFIGNPPPPPPPPGPTPPVDPEITQLDTDNNLKRWFDTPHIVFEDGNLFINSFDMNDKKGRILINKLFRSITKSNYYSNRAESKLKDLGFEFSSDKDSKDLYANQSFEAATPSIARFLENAIKASEHLAKKDGSAYYVKLLRGIVDYHVNGSAKIDKISINLNKFDAHYGINAVKIKGELLDSVDPAKIDTSNPKITIIT